VLQGFMNMKERNQIEFFQSLLYERIHSSRIPIKQLVPVEWDYMKVFHVYTTKEMKIEFAGYQYANNLDDVNYEDEVSLLFMKGGKVMYYVDSLLPRLFQYQIMDHGLVKLSSRGGYSVEIDSSMIPNFSDWGYYPLIEEAAIEDEPYFEIGYRGEGSISLILDCQ
jgi:hypothetical protein